MPHTPIFRESVQVLGRQEFAFFRGYLEGLPVNRLGARYLGLDDGRAAGLRLAEIRAALQHLALRSGFRRSVVRVLEILPERLEAHEQAAGISLDEFRNERDPDGFYSEQELIELYQEEYGGELRGVDSKAARNERLRRRQQSLLDALQRELPAAPSATSHIAGWLAPHLARRLESTGISTLGDLAELIRHNPKAWWRSVPRVGPTTATSLFKWLRAEGLVGELARQAPSSRRLLTLEHLRPPAHLSEEFARTKSWLAQLAEISPNTARTYRKEVERYVLFCVVERTDARTMACNRTFRAYEDFLGAVSTPAGAWPYQLPRSAWVGDRRATRRDTVEWRPFTGPLSITSRRLAHDVVKAFLNNRDLFAGPLQSQAFNFTAPVLSANSSRS